MTNKILDIIINKDLSNKTIKYILKEKYDFSNRIISKVKNIKGIIKNGMVANINDIVNYNDILEIYIEENNSENIIPKKMDLDIIYEDEYIFIVNKPPNLVVHPTSYHFDDTLANGVVHYFNKKGIECKFRAVNRLDRDTSGIIVIAKSQLCHSLLSNLMINGEFHKEYIAIVHGKIENNKDIIDAPIDRKPNSIIEREISDTGQKSLTQYEVITKNQIASFVKINLLTGRTHQIRVHFKHIGHILFGDKLYGAIDNFERQALHCNNIRFIHPITNKQLNINSSIPKDISNLIAELRLEINS